jgi:hypothetical protein
VHAHRKANNLAAGVGAMDEHRDDDAAPGLITDERLCAWRKQAKNNTDYTDLARITRRKCNWALRAVGFAFRVIRVQSV